MTERTLRDIRTHCETVIAACEQGYPQSAYNEARAVLRILDAHAQPVPDAASTDNTALVEALRPFAEYMHTPADGPMDCDYHGKPLPDDQGVGWVYLTYGDFRRAHAALASREAAQPAPDADAPFQSRVQPWMMTCFGAEISADRLERGDRLLEEVLELLQSNGYPHERIASLSSYVWSRPKGEPAQEAGGVMVTLAAYCLAYGIDMHEAGETELARVWTKVEKIRAKHAAKPTGSALLQAWPAQPAPDTVGDAELDLAAPDVATEMAISSAARIIAMQAVDTGRTMDRWFVPQVQWVKDFPGQVTDGRIGRPTLTLCPVSWLPKQLGDAVLAALAKGHQQ